LAKAGKNISLIGYIVKLASRLDGRIARLPARQGAFRPLREFQRMEASIAEPIEMAVNTLETSLAMRWWHLTP
jgi:hypothetical protein